jgi:hypothetical protein
MCRDWSVEPDSVTTQNTLPTAIDRFRRTQNFLDRNETIFCTYRQFGGPASNHKATPALTPPQPRPMFGIGVSSDLAAPGRGAWEAIASNVCS